MVVICVMIPDSSTIAFPAIPKGLQRLEGLLSQVAGR